MRNTLLLPLFIMLLFSCGDISTRNKVYPHLESKTKLVKEHDLEYKNDFSNLEISDSKETKSWVSKQSNITKTYFEENGLEDYSRYIEDEYNKSGPDRYWYKVNGQHHFYWEDTDTTQVLYMGELTRMDDIPVFSTSMENIVHFYSPSPDNSKFLLFISEEEGDFIKVMDTKSGNILFKTDKDMNMQQNSYALWASKDKIVFTGWPNQNNSKDSYLAMADINNNKIEKIFDGSKVQNYENEDFIRPSMSSYGTPHLRACLINASEHFSTYTAEFSDDSFELNWKHLYGTKDSIVYYAKERNSEMFFLRYRKGKKVLVKNSMQHIEEPDRDIELFNPPTGTEITEFCLTKNNIYVITSQNGTDEKLYSIDEKSEVKMVDLDYPISNISIYFDSGSEPIVTILQSDWKYNYTFINIDDSLNIVRNELMTRHTPEKFKNISTKIVEVESHDGTLVPMTILTTKDYTPKGNNKGIIYAYGAYGISVEAFYEPEILDFVSKGNVYAVAHVRGGAEKGLKWYTSGIKDKKMNSWKDLLACSQYLKDKGFVGNNRLGVSFGSAGGVTCAMAINEDPGMFKAAVGTSALLNPIRLGYQENFNDSENQYDFGTLETLEGFKSLIKLDPVLNFKENMVYPSTLLLAGEKDEMIPVYDAAKYIALLQNHTPEPRRTYLLDLYEDVGHYLPIKEESAKTMLFFNKEL